MRGNYCWAALYVSSLVPLAGDINACDERIEPMKMLKKVLLDRDVLIDVSKIVIYENEDFDLGLINNVNDRFVEKIYNLLVDKKKNIIPKDELVDFIFLLKSERKENKICERKAMQEKAMQEKTLQKTLQKALGKTLGKTLEKKLEKKLEKTLEKKKKLKNVNSCNTGVNDNCPIKNEVTSLIKKINKFYFHFKEFILKRVRGKMRETAGDNLGEETQHYDDITMGGMNYQENHFEDHTGDIRDCFFEKDQNGHSNRMNCQQKENEPIEEKETTQRTIPKILSSMRETESEGERGRKVYLEQREGSNEGESFYEEYGDYPGVESETGYPKTCESEKPYAKCDHDVSSHGVRCTQHIGVAEKGHTANKAYFENRISEMEEEKTTNDCFEDSLYSDASCEGNAGNATNDDENSGKNSGKNNGEGTGKWNIVRDQRRGDHGEDATFEHPDEEKDEQEAIFLEKERKFINQEKKKKKKIFLNKTKERDRVRALVKMSQEKQVENCDEDNYLGDAYTNCIYSNVKNPPLQLSCERSNSLNSCFNFMPPKNKLTHEFLNIHEKTPKLHKMCSQTKVCKEKEKLPCSNGTIMNIPSKKKDLKKGHTEDGAGITREKSNEDKKDEFYKNGIEGNDYSLSEKREHCLGEDKLGSYGNANFEGDSTHKVEVRERNLRMEKLNGLLSKGEIATTREEEEEEEENDYVGMNNVSHEFSDEENFNCSMHKNDLVQMANGGNVCEDCPYNDNYKKSKESPKLKKYLKNGEINLNESGNIVSIGKNLNESGNIISSGKNLNESGNIISSGKNLNESGNISLDEKKSATFHANSDDHSEEPQKEKDWYNRYDKWSVSKKEKKGFIFSYNDRTLNVYDTIHRKDYIKNMEKEDIESEYQRGHCRKLSNSIKDSFRSDERVHNKQEEYEGTTYFGHKCDVHDQDKDSNDIRMMKNCVYGEESKERYSANHDDEKGIHRNKNYYEKDETLFPFRKRDLIGYDIVERHSEDAQGKEHSNFGETYRYEDINDKLVSQNSDANLEKSYYYDDYADFKYPYEKGLVKGGHDGYHAHYGDLPQDDCCDDIGNEKDVYDRTGKRALDSYYVSECDEGNENGVEYIKNLGHHNELNDLKEDKCRKFSIFRKRKEEDAVDNFNRGSFDKRARSIDGSYGSDRGRLVSSSEWKEGKKSAGFGRHMEDDAAYYENMASNMDDRIDAISCDDTNENNFNRKDFLLLKKKKEEDSRLRKWLSKINARENEKKKKIREKKKESIQKELIDCTFQPCLNTNKMKRINTMRKKETKNMYSQDFHTFYANYYRGESCKDGDIINKQEKKHFGRAYEQCNTEIKTNKGIRKNDIIDTGRTESNGRSGDLLLKDLYGEYNTGEKECTINSQGHWGVNTKKTMYNEDKMGKNNIDNDIIDRGKSIDRNKILYFKAMKQKEEFHKKKVAYEKAKEDALQKECKFHPAIKNNVKIFLSELPNGYNKTVERIKRGVEEKKRVNDFLQFRMPHNNIRRNEKTIISPFSFDKGLYKVKIKPVYFETKIKISENKIASLAIREDEDPLYIVDIFCKIHALKNEEKNILYKYILDELNKLPLKN
ncbi:conserved Plasmodium protein, unknown function [Plasmodium ovale wallikeri]|uniref:Uncharacterized protein n=1 Tax=Plasmodium ovale wallikeri TaxID=864142 RepID=A0A1A8YXF6_PLAOA|nr:conserved Plasmodium protein, unknown function [Plasmodium ovale wallikeri]